MQMSIEEFILNNPIPEMKNTRVVAILKPWIDVGRVGSLTLEKLEKLLGAQEFSKFRKPGKYFDFTRIRPYTRQEKGRKVFDIPNCLINHAKDSENDIDYLFLHLMEPHNNSEEFCESIVDFLKMLKVKEYCRIGGFYDSVPHSRPLIVTGSLTDQQIQKTNGLVSQNTSEYQGPTSIVNLVAQELEKVNDIEVTSLMVHLPQYVQFEQDHLGTFRLCQVLCKMFDLKYDLSDEHKGQEQYKYIEQLIENNPNASKDIITKLEKQYDGKYDEDLDTDFTINDLPLLPDIEKFLREVGNRLDENASEDK